MKMCGVMSLILAALSFFFWLVSWVVVTFLYERFGYDNPLRLVGQLCNALSVMSTTGAIATLGFGLLMAPKQPAQNGKPRDDHD